LYVADPQAGCTSRVAIGIPGARSRRLRRGQLPTDVAAPNWSGRRVSSAKPASRSTASSSPSADGVPRIIRGANGCDTRHDGPSRLRLPSLAVHERAKTEVAKSWRALSPLTAWLQTQVGPSTTAEIGAISQVVITEQWSSISPQLHDHHVDHDVSSGTDLPRSTTGARIPRRGQSGAFGSARTEERRPPTAARPTASTPDVVVARCLVETEPAAVVHR